MARRTITEIYDEICLEKANMSQLKTWIINQDNPNSVLDDHQTLLDDLMNSSKVAAWRLFLWIVAFAIWVHEGLWEEHKAEVETHIEENIPHTSRWYQEECLKFQYGDELVWNTDKRRFEYSEFDLSRQIIKRSAVVESSMGGITIKVARDLNGEMAPLSTEQLLAFTGFWGKYKDAGVVIKIISSVPDLLKLGYQIKYDPMVINPDGTLINDSGVRPVDEAILNYIANLNFNGRFRPEECDAAVRSAKGVIDFNRIYAQSKYGVNSYQDIVFSSESYAGHYKIDPDNDLETTIEYLANV